MNKQNDMQKMKRREYRKRLRDAKRADYIPPFKRKERTMLEESEGRDMRQKARNRKKKFN